MDNQRCLAAAFAELLSRNSKRVLLPLLLSPLTPFSPCYLLPALTRKKEIQKLWLLWEATLSPKRPGGTDARRRGRPASRRTPSPLQSRLCSSQSPSMFFMKAPPAFPRRIVYQKTSWPVPSIVAVKSGDCPQLVSDNPFLPPCLSERKTSACPPSQPARPMP